MCFRVTNYRWQLGANDQTLHSLRCVMVAIDGLNPDDPGIQLLSMAARDRPAADILLAYCGELPGLPPGATRLILDCREQVGTTHTCVAARLDAPVPHRSPQSDGFGVALLWPRAHLGKDFSQRALAEAAVSLRPGGILYCAARKQKGGQSLAAAMRTLLGNVRVVARDRGYHLYRSDRGESLNQAAAEAFLSVQYQFADAALGLDLVAAPGVFSRRRLDDGTRCLIEHVAGHPPHVHPACVVDLCSGVGPLGLWALSRWPQARALMVESNFLAAAAIEHNAKRRGLSARTEVVVSDGLPRGDGTDREGWRAFKLRTQLVLCNPPTHAEAEGLDRLLGPIGGWLAPGGVAHVVANRPGRSKAALESSGASVAVTRYDRYWVLTATWSGGQ